MLLSVFIDYLIPFQGFHQHDTFHKPLELPPSMETCRASKLEVSSPFICSSFVALRLTVVVVLILCDFWEVYRIISTSNLFKIGSPHEKSCMFWAHLLNISTTFLYLSNLNKPYSTLVSPSPVGQRGHFKLQWLLGLS